MAVRSLVVALLAVAALTTPVAAQVATPAAKATPEPEAAFAPLVWHWTAFVDPRGTPTPAAATDRSTLQIGPDGRVALRADCNRGFGRAVVGAGTIHFDGIATTRMACGKTSQASDFLAALDAATHWRYDGPDLLVLADDGSGLRFAPSLPGVVWQWQGTAMMNDTRVVPADAAAYTLAFRGDTVAIRADCNRIAGRFTVEQSQIDITPTGIPTGVCGPGSLSDRFLRDLDDAGSFVFRAGRLYLALPADAGILEFAATLPAPEATPVAGDEA
ncbi:MAG TPA: META domain-containing protein [Thermomicrobiales bacterium]|jgi:heat shock protein HslJ|nr:META domain-containing protein [Thermomicrobiales bacterium]